MDAYIRNELSISSDLTLDQAATHSAKLLTWLLDCQDEMQQQQQRHQKQLLKESEQLQLSYTDIECMFKATLYLCECHARHGDELVEAVLLQCSSAQEAMRRFYESCERDRTQCIRELCAHIVHGTRNGHTHAALLYQLHKCCADLQPGWSIIKELDWSQLVEHTAERRPNDTLDVATAAAVGEYSADALQMRTLVRRIFRLASKADMQTALERAMRHLSSELWLQLFREPRESLLYARCAILRQMICDTLAAGGCTASASASAGFVHRLYAFVADDARSLNVSRLLRLLMHVRLAAALGSYMRGYWAQQLPRLQLAELQLTAAEQALLPLEEMLYLTHLLLTPKSPCRAQLYEELRKLPPALLQRLLELLNKVAFVYS
ncbi:hypothetical protein KR222_008109 [Zaprionus bogoriensis]|nr:hypothetical protein KR222_008109 [Zaprionus bogoriensis]